jgi:hypothetical protein
VLNLGLFCVGWVLGTFLKSVYFLGCFCNFRFLLLDSAFWNPANLILVLKFALCPSCRTLGTFQEVLVVGCFLEFRFCVWKLVFSAIGGTKCRSNFRLAEFRSSGTK